MNKIDFQYLYREMKNDPFLYITGFVAILVIIITWGLMCFICPPILVTTILIIAITIFTWQLVKRLAKMQKNEDKKNEDEKFGCKACALYNNGCDGISSFCDCGFITQKKSVSKSKIQEKENNDEN